MLREGDNHPSRCPVNHFVFLETRKQKTYSGKGPFIKKRLYLPKITAMVKNLLTFAFAILLCIAGQGQTASSTDANTQELKTKQTRFSQLSEKKQYPQAIEEGIRISVLLTQNHRYKEAFAVCRQMDALLQDLEKETRQPDFPLLFSVGRERLRIYIRLKNADQCKSQVELLKTYANQAGTDVLQEEVWLLEANYYQTFGMTDKSLACYKQLVQKRATGKDEKGVDACYKGLLKQAEENNDAALAIAMRKLYTVWQDSVKAVKTASELETLQAQYDTSRKVLQEKEDKISIWLFILIGLSVLCLFFAAASLYLAVSRSKHIRQEKKLRQSLQVSNENNEQHSKLIGRISACMEPALDTINDAATQFLAPPALQENTEALKRFIADVRIYAELEETREVRFPLKELNILSLCESVMEKAKVNFKPEVEAVLNVPRVNIKTNAAELERILLYLLKNAAEHTKKGKITLEFKRRGAHIHQFILSDTGTGIPAEEQENLFKPFAGVQDLKKGSRLGLPTCNLIAYKLNGILTRDANYKKGTRFVLELHS